jgi:type I restriction enzyme, S subunit
VNVHWPMRRLGDVFDIARGGSPRPIEEYITEEADGLNWIKIGDASASGKFIEKTKEKIRREGLSKTRYVERGDFLWTNSMSFGRPYIMATDGCIHDGWLVLKPRNGSLVYPDYFYHLLGSDAIYKQFAARAGGSTVKNLNSEIVSSIEVRLPPFDEQRRIAAILDKADALRLKRKQTSELLDGLAQSIFLEMFGNPAENPKNYEVLAFESLLEISPNFGSMNPPQKERLEWISLRVANIQNWALSLEDLKYIDLRDEDVDRHTLRDGDIILARAIASEEHLGKCVVVRPAGRKWAFDSHLMRIRLNQNIVDPVYARELFRTPGGRQIFLRSTRKTTVQYNINTKELRALRIPVPPISLQRVFVSRVGQLGALEALGRNSRLEIDDLFSSLQHRAFSGQL